MTGQGKGLNSWLAHSHGHHHNLCRWLANLDSRHRTKIVLLNPSPQHPHPHCHPSFLHRPLRLFLRPPQIGYRSSCPPSEGDHSAIGVRRLQELTHRNVGSCNLEQLADSWCSPKPEVGCAMAHGTQCKAVQQHQNALGLGDSEYRTSCNGSAACYSIKCTRHGDDPIRIGSMRSIAL